MIIKDKPFHIPACQAIVCWYFASPAVPVVAITSPVICDADFVRRWPGFLKLEAYQVRLSRYLVMRRAALLAHNFALRDKLIFCIASLHARYAYARFIVALRSLQARVVLDQLGGLGGVW